MPSAVRRPVLLRRTPRRGPAPARLILVLGLLGSLALPVALPQAATAGTASASTASASTASAARAAGPVVAITSMSRPFASDGQKLTVRGTVTNTSRATLSGVTVQLMGSASGSPFQTTEGMQAFAAGKDPAAAVPEARAVDKIRGTIAPGVTAHWTTILPVNEVGMGVFGVYPLAAQATDTLGTVLGTSWTLLPFWPSAKSRLRPDRDGIAWIWPLIDIPDQGPCAGLLNNHLAASLASGGRLDGLLSAGASAAGRAARLTWVVDPALLSSAATMAGPGKTRYQVGASPHCRGGRSYPASASARDWLARLSTATDNQPSFVTPYADADIAALLRAGMADDLHQAFAQGRAEARKILGPRSVPAAAGAGRPSQSSLISEAVWPPNGMANYATLENLAAADGIRMAVLSTAAMPPQAALSYTPSAVAHTPNGVGGQMRVLLADSGLSQILGRASAARTPGTQFSVKQSFLAETALIASQSPHLPRAMVVAPPRRWNPPAGLASALLSETSHAPWLSPTSAGSLAADRHAPGQAARQQPVDGSRDRFSPSLTRAIKAADHGVQLVQGLRSTPSQQLSSALAGVESSAWRDLPHGRRSARSILHRVNVYVSSQENGVSLIDKERTTLGGQKGSVPVSIYNRLDYTVRVKVRLFIDQTPGRQLTVLPGSGVHMVTSDQAVTGLIEVKKGTQVTAKLQVRATGVGTTQIGMRLLTARGQVLPGRMATMTVKTTHFGTFALVILAAALGIFMITSAGRAVRRGRGPGTDTEDADAQQDESGEGAKAGPEGQVSGDAPARSGARGGEQPGEADNVVHDRARSDAAGTDQDLTEDADDDARVPGWAYRG